MKDIVQYQRLAWRLAVAVVIEPTLLAVLLAHALALEAGPYLGWMVNIPLALIFPGIVLREMVRPGITLGSYGYVDWLLMIAGSWFLFSALGIVLLRFLFIRSLRP